jgi:hypothetical protein
MGLIGASLRLFATFYRVTTHRKPIWVVEVSWDCGDRAAGR